MVPSLSSHGTELYDSKTFIAHAASLHQSFLHCAIFPTAASRRSLDRVSVPMWPITLSGRLLIVDLVSRYPTNYLIRREPVLYRITPLTTRPCDPAVSCGISVTFATLFPCIRLVAHALLTRPPLKINASIRKLPLSFSARLACVRRAASVRPEPGSNSQLKFN